MKISSSWVFCTVRIVFSSFINCFYLKLFLYEMNCCLFSAEPMRKKKKMDPGITKAREDRKRRKVEKVIRRLEKNEGQLKPIEEVETSLKLLKETK